MEAVGLELGHESPAGTPELDVAVPAAGYHTFAEGLLCHVVWGVCMLNHVGLAIIRNDVALLPPPTPFSCNAIHCTPMYRSAQALTR